MGRAKTLPLPEGFTAADIRLESSVCTGERTIGFYSKADRKLHFAELVTSKEDIREFYEKYGIEKP
ncbi:MAG: hypothetical protein J6M90_03885 [Oscillospiraceae bacterium]|nr:hypothetical protein [Oscillospiraceae bacterium]